jgi:predicted enzyme related to lactoylglutathione lyase
VNPSFMLYTNDIPGMTAFYTALGFKLRVAGRGCTWAELTWDSFTLALHGQTGELPPTGRLCIGFETNDLDRTVRDLNRAGLNPPAIIDESFGRMLQLTDPDGNALSITQYEPELYA